MCDSSTYGTTTNSAGFLHRLTIRSGFSKGGLPLLLMVGGCDRATPTSVALPIGELRSAVGPVWSDWSEPMNLTAVNSSAQDNQPTLSPDQLSLYFASSRAGGYGGNDIWVARRASLDSPWQTPVNVGPPINGPANDQGPTLSNDGLLLFFHSNRPDGHGEQDIYVSRRIDKHDDFSWAPVANLGADVNTSNNEAGPMYMQHVEAGPVNLYFSRGPTGADIDIYSAEISRDGETRGPAVPVSELNFAVAGITDARTTVRRDSREVIFFSTRPGGFGMADLYVSVRQNVDVPWSAPLNLGQPLNTAFTDTQPSLSFDGRTLVFSSNRPGGLGSNDIWISTRTLQRDRLTASAG